MRLLVGLFRPLALNPQALHGSWECLRKVSCGPQGKGKDGRGERVDWEVRKGGRGKGSC